DGRFPRSSRFHGIARTPGFQIRGITQVGHLFHRLVGRAVFAQTNGVVGVYENRTLLHQGSHTHGVTGVFHKHQEGGAVRNKAFVQRDAVHHGAHGKFAYAVEYVVTGSVGFAHALATFPQGQVRTGEVGGTAEEFRQQRAKGVQCVLRGFTRGNHFAFGLAFFDISLGFGGKVGRQFAVDAAFEFRRQFRVSRCIGSKFFIPALLSSGAFFFGTPTGVDIFRNVEGTVFPAQTLAGEGDFVIAQRCAVALFFAFFIRGTETNNGFAADQGRLFGIGTGGFNGLFDFFRVVTVHARNDLPAVSFKTLHGVVGKPAFHFAVDGNAVVIVEGNQFA